MRPKNLLVIAPAFPDEFDKEIGGIFVKEQLKYIKDYFDNVYVISPTTIWKKYLIKEHYSDYSWDNVRVYRPMTVNLPFPYVPKHLRKVWISLEKYEILKFIKSKNINFDLIHAHYTWYPGALAIELKRNFKVPVVITEHTSITFSKAIREKDSLFIQSWMQCDGIIRVRKSDLPFFKEVGIPLEKIYCIPNGFDGKKFAKLDMEWCRKKLNLPLNKKIILNVGNLYGEVKGHKYLVEAMSYISKRRDDVLCVIVGEGKLKDELDNQIKMSDLDEYISIVGGKTHDEIPLWINACDVFVLPSLSESFGIVQIEAMACGKPVVATFNGGSEEIIVSEDYGYLVEPKESENIANEILLALNDSWDDQAILNYAKHFTWENITEKICLVYDALIGQNSLGSSHDTSAACSVHSDTQNPH